MCWFCDGKVVGLLSPYSITVVYMPGTSIGFSVSAVSSSCLEKCIHLDFHILKAVRGLHSPSTCLVQNFQIFTGDTYLHSPHMFQGSLSIQFFGLHSPSRFKIYKFSREFIIFILTLSTHVSRFTLHALICFTLSKHIVAINADTCLHGGDFVDIYMST